MKAVLFYLSLLLPLTSPLPAPPSPFLLIPNGGATSIDQGSGDDSDKSGTDLEGFGGDGVGSTEESEEGGIVDTADEDSEVRLRVRCNSK